MVIRACTIAPARAEMASTPTAHCAARGKSDPLTPPSPERGEGAERGFPAGAATVAAGLAGVAAIRNPRCVSIRWSMDDAPIIYSSRIQTKHLAPGSGETYTM